MLTVFPLSMKGDLKSKQNPVPMLVSGFDLNDFRGNGSVCNGNQSLNFQISPDRLRLRSTETSVEIKSRGLLKIEHPCMYIWLMVKWVFLGYLIADEFFYCQQPTTQQGSSRKKSRKRAKPAKKNILPKLLLPACLAAGAHTRVHPSLLQSSVLAWQKRPS
ncbi:hypothetical protein T4D_16495 [Trichinella pseudospiralis]|uniref:Uncharacterized protein n=1 Tax=Trichinella pseudospiralis TaxID=6337 RepID=A0A0V1FYV0_TRIPS|nr:hypothetical protein T4D_16495 [Trichinella pseudospiralis]